MKKLFNISNLWGLVTILGCVLFGLGIDELKAIMIIPGIGIIILGTLKCIFTGVD